MSAAKRTRERVMNAGEAGGVVDNARAALPAELIHDDEVIILMLRPSILFVPLSCALGLMLILITTLALALAAVQLSWVPWSEPQAYYAGLAGAALRLGWQLMEWYYRVYVLTDRRVIRRAGVLRMSVFETPLKHVQHTAVYARVRERLFGLGSIGFATAGSDVFDVVWVMVRQPFAVHRTVVEAIRKYGP